MKKIVVRLFGGLGNQLFIYAAARRMALINHAELLIDDVSGFSEDYVYKRYFQLDHFSISYKKATSAERLEPFSRIRRYFLRRWNQHKPYEQRTYLMQDGVDLDQRLINFKLKGNLYLEGYWQSEDYFKDVEDVIRRDLKIIPPTDVSNLLMAEQIGRCNAVSVHVRFFDEPQILAINNAPTDYYLRAIETMERMVPDAHYFIFSDQVDTARNRIPLLNDRVTFVVHNKGDENAYADLWLMSQCKHFIIANSTFSWWGAWLSANPSKHVIAPGFEMRYGKMWWGFKGLLPSNWIKL